MIFVGVWIGLSLYLKFELQFEKAGKHAYSVCINVFKWEVSGLHSKFIWTDGVFISLWKSDNPGLYILLVFVRVLF